MKKLIRYWQGSSRRNQASQRKLLEKEWFAGGDSYWSNCQPTNDGMLGGYSHLHEQDIAQSRLFLQHIIQQRGLPTNSALDCGAGIGRVSKSLLSNVFTHVPNLPITQVDLVDQSHKLIDAARTNLAGIGQIRQYYAQGLQDFRFEHAYDCIWLQWALCNLPQLQAQQFLLKARLQMEHTQGIMIVKENQLDSDGFEVDMSDYTISRSRVAHTGLFEDCGLTIVAQRLQKDWPEELHKINMYCLVAK